MKHRSPALWAAALLALSSTALAGRVAVAEGPAAGVVPGRLLVRFRAGIPEARVQGLLASARAVQTAAITQIDVRVLQLPAQASEAAFAALLERQPEVEFAEPDAVAAPAYTPNDPWFPNQWQLNKIEAPAAWDLKGAGSITVAILDTGVDANHEDLAAQMVAGWNSYDGNFNSADVNGHGTRVAGTVAAGTHNSLGVASVAGGCKIMPVRISDLQGYGYASSVSRGLTWAADQGARVANISYDFTDNATVAAAARYFEEKGGVVTMSAGNDGIAKTTPDNPYVLTVTATESTDTLASWSTYGTNVDLAAPKSALTPSNGGGYATASGTSFSAPTVAGVAALVISASPTLGGRQVQDILKQSADDRGAAGWDTQFGWGRVNARRAVSLAIGSGDGDASPPSVSFVAPSGTVVSGSVTLQAAASDNVAVASITFSVDGAALASMALAPYATGWNTLSVPDGPHVLRVTAKDAVGNAATTDLTVTVRNAVDAYPPVTHITSPESGVTLTGTSVTVTGAASDDVGVMRVDFYVDGSLIGSSATAPYSARWNMKKASRGAHSLSCQAVDGAGNRGVSAAVTIYR